MKVIYNQEKLREYHKNKLSFCPNCNSANLYDETYTPCSDNPELTIIYQGCDDCDWCGTDVDIFERIEK